MKNKTRSKTANIPIKIGIFDSGMGGTTIFCAVKKELEAANLPAEYFYIADSKNCPYGEKSDNELKKIVVKNTEELINWGAKIIIIACNTATVRCISYLREKYPETIFVGTEPAIKLATKSNKKNILVLATPGTIRSERTQKLIEKNQNQDQEITLLSCPGLADAIEHTLSFTKDYQVLPPTQNQQNIITEKLATLFQQITSTPDVVVLGCTHYPLIKTEIQKFFKNATLIDGADGVARQVEKLIKKIYHLV